MVVNKIEFYRLDSARKRQIKIEPISLFARVRPRALQITTISV